ncbi:YajQ family cyclic di-GMP-binding protein [Pleionea litopenaei]|uniref:Nucleotide-binding protein Q9312_09570 n=1 Tax=Pleionea litopenaei TaxID=3070815 RepID=A0AA51X8P0_9GAMM|nr:YajQ family cyclic di-GMP-binding protein [Pleionea sp. HL-JVS1]WMS89139.1 YajQ family cyclic di-GMP-binding protein [Pleionea sp. HL-JVS1]
MPSFDIITEIEATEIRNAVENSNRELDTRYDFKNVEAKFEFKDDSVKVVCESDFQVQQMMEILRNNCTKRKIDPRSLKSGDIQHVGKSYFKEVSFIQGIDKDVAKKLVKLIKDSKIKVQPSIQGDKVRVTGKKRDDLQAAMAVVREAELDQPFQFDNFRD